MRDVKQRLASTRLADGTEIAYAAVGQGPLLVHAPGWLTHLEASWAMPAERGFYEMLAGGRTLVRYDKPGCGLSGPTTRAPSLALEVETLEAVLASVTSTAGTDTVELFGASLGAAVAASLAATRPGTISRLVLYGGWVRGHDLATAEIRTHVLGLISQHWGLGSDVLVDIFAPGADPATRAAFTHYQREAASPQIARGMLAAAYELDITDQLARITAPTLWSIGTGIGPRRWHRAGRWQPVSRGRGWRSWPGGTICRTSATPSDWPRASAGSSTSRHRVVARWPS